MNDAFATRWIKTVQQNSAVRTHLLHPTLETYLGEGSERMKSLDIGCGEGFSTKLLMKTPGRVYGVDREEDLVKKAQEQYGAKADFMQSAMTSLPYANATMDRILAEMSLMTPTDGEVVQAIHEMHRVLRIGGIAAIAITHPLYDLFVRQKDTATITSYCASEKFHSTTQGYECEPEHRRPINWYFNAFRKAGFAVDAMDELAIKEFPDMSERYATRVGHPIFATFKLRKEYQK